MTNTQQMIAVLHLLICSQLWTISKEESNEITEGSFQVHKTVEDNNSVDNSYSECFAEFRNFVQKYGRAYVNSPKEFFRRFDIFRENRRRHETLNQIRPHAHLSARFGITEFSDLSQSEFSAMFLKAKPAPNPGGFILKSNKKIRPVVLKAPKLFDWRIKGVVTPVKSQGTCGACWAFSVVEQAESLNAIRSGTVQELSVQEVISCAPEGGCDGGDICATADWLVRKRINLTTETDYPLSGGSGSCKQPMPKSGVQLQGFSCRNFVGDEDTLLQAIRQGPVSVSVDATLWQDYMGGIIQHHCYNKLNHAVVLVGYNNTGQVPYYIARNSWGADFGNGGYVYIAIGQNNCGVAEEVLSVH